MTFERVFSVNDFYDGPRAGVANFEGAPHFYESEWDDDGTFRLTAISDGVLRLVQEDWAIWLRWRAAFDAGTTTIDTHPALPADRERHLELKPLLAEQLVTGQNFVRATGTFRSNLEVRWQRL